MSRAAHHSKEQQKALGAYYTPSPVAAKLVEWSVREPSDLVLDPSCGGMVFVEAARDRLSALGAELSKADSQVFGADLDRRAVTAGHQALPSLVDQLKHVDFFEAQPDVELPVVDAVVG